MIKDHWGKTKQVFASIMAVICTTWASPGFSYTFNEIVPDVRQPAAVSGGSAVQ
jgi:hypothetical protein